MKFTCLILIFICLAKCQEQQEIGDYEDGQWHDDTQAHPKDEFIHYLNTHCSKQLESIATSCHFSAESIKKTTQEENKIENQLLEIQREFLSKMDNKMKLEQDKLDIIRQERIIQKIDEHRREDNENIYEVKQLIKELKSKRDQVVECDQLKKIIEDLKSEKESECLQERSPVCRVPFVHVGKRCMFIGKETMNFDHATSFCSSYQAHLPDPSSPDLMALFRNFLDASFPPANAIYWVSATDREVEGQWKWLDGTHLGSKDRRYWRVGEPQAGKPNEDCAVIVRTSRWLLHDTYCESKFTPACEYTLE